MEQTESVDIEMEDGDLLILFKMAHERDITFNQLINEILRHHLDAVVKPL